jgi:hypothetical protein
MGPVWFGSEIIVGELAPLSIADAGAAVDEERGKRGER